MPQVSDQTVQNASGAAVRVDINGLMGALFSSSSGAAAPTPTVAGMLWFDTTNGILNVRNAANTLWVAVLNASSNLSDLANIATARTNLGGTSAGIAIWMAANVAAQRSALGLVIGTDIPPLSSPTFIDIPKAPTAAPGTNSTQLATTAFATLLANGFTSAEQTLTAAGLLTIAHGLGRVPNFVELRLINKVTEAGWSAGDTLVVYANSNSAGANRQHSVYPDATNIRIRFSDNVTMFIIAHKTTGVSADLVTLANWRLIVRAF